jgi:hypothetical protein
MAASGRKPAAAKTSSCAGTWQTRRMSTSPIAVKKPLVSVIKRILEQRNGLIVHFSGAPKGAGVERGSYYPADLQHVCAGHAMGGVSCSVVLPADNFSGDYRNATGCIGLVLELTEPDSLVAVFPVDCGSMEEDGNRVVENPRDITSQDVEDSISQRPADRYNEWVLRDFRVVGVFSAPPYEVSKIAHLEYPEDMPQHLRNPDPEPTTGCTSIAEIQQNFPGMDIFSFQSGQIVRL